jgi:hypothetical protein
MSLWHGCPPLHVGGDGLGYFDHEQAVQQNVIP